jgi:hypothetical protein
VSLPAVTSIGDAAFDSVGGQALTITLGSTPPTIGKYLFQYATVKSVTVKVPYAQADGENGWEAAGYHTNGWGITTLTIKSSL